MYNTYIHNEYAVYNAIMSEITPIKPPVITLPLKSNKQFLKDLELKCTREGYQEDTYVKFMYNDEVISLCISCASTLKI